MMGQMKLVWGLVLASVLMTGCANKYVVRNAETLQANTAFTNQLVTEFKGAMESMIERDCRCNPNNEWVRDDGQGNMVPDPTCSQAAELVVVTAARWPWHYAMTQYLNGFTEERPSEQPPTIPANSSLCEEMSNGE